MKTNIILVTLLVCFFSSCESILDQKPTDFISPESFYSNETELRSALNGVYSQLTESNCYGNNYLYLFNANTDESYGYANLELEPTYQYSSTTTKVNLFWNACYIGIERANMLLANINKADIDGTKRNIIKGETLFLRSFFYFILVSNYGDVPLKIIPTASVNDVNIARTPTKEVYNQILTDMVAADTLLKSQTATSLGYGGRISRTAVQGMLARVCLYMAGYPLNDKTKYIDALYWAKKVVDSKEHALNPEYKSVFMNYITDKYDVKESIWELEFFRNNDGLINKGGTYAGRFCGISTTNADIGYSTGSIRVTKKLYDLYGINPQSTTTPNKDSYDLRRDWNCANYTWTSTGVKSANTNTWRMCAGKWRREYEIVTPKSTVYTPENFPMLRYSDVLLMLAEAENEVHGATDTAYNAINQVRRRAYGLLLSTPPNPAVNADLPSGLSKEQFLKAIRDERSREFCFEALRRSDLIRWGNFIGDMKDFLAYAQANGGTATNIITASTLITDRNLLLPIPSYDMSLNKLLTQNPGY